MKKTLISAVVAIALVLTMAVSAFAASSTASYATTAPKIDGEIDAIWETTAAQYTEDSSVDEDEATGYTKILWDEGNLYFLAVVTDYTPVDAADASCTNGVNFWVSENNTEAEDFATEVGDYLYFVSSNGIDQLEADKLYIDNAAPFQVALKAVKATDTGYVVEAKIPSCQKLTYSVGHVIGYTCSIDDDYDANGERDEYTFTARDVDMGGSADNYWSATQALGEVELVAAPAAPEAPVVPETPAEPEAPVVPVVPETPVVTPSNPSTADVTAIFYALASISAIGGVALINKRK